MKHTRCKKNVGRLVLFGALLIALMIGMATQDLWASEYGDDEEIPFDEAHLFYELNNTDGDLGIHAKIDGEGWKRLKIEDLKERKMLDIKVRGRLRKQGLTEIFFESAEPTFDELDPKDFFDRFPEGTYEIEGITLEGQELEREVELTHVMPAPPEVSIINGMAERMDAAEDCDAELPVVDPSEPVLIIWEPVEWSHPDPDGGGAGVQPPVPVTIHNYEVVVEIDDTPWVTSTILPPNATAFEVPQEILELVQSGGAIKFEVLAREASYNQTAVESCFEVE
jgi:hypothetical protein